MQNHILTRILRAYQNHNHHALIMSPCSITGCPDPSEEEVEIISRTNTLHNSKKSNSGHQEYPHLLCVHHIINYRVSGSQILSPTNSRTHIDSYQTNQSPPYWHSHKNKYNQHWYPEKTSPLKRGDQPQTNQSFFSNMHHMRHFMHNISKIKVCHASLRTYHLCT